MYWETLELALLRYRPHLEVRTAGSIWLAALVFAVMLIRQEEPA
jgi:hypothetical protein